MTRLKLPLIEIDYISLFNDTKSNLNKCKIKIAPYICPIELHGQSFRRLCRQKKFKIRFQTGLIDLILWNIKRRQL